MITTAKSTSAPPSQWRVKKTAARAKLRISGAGRNPDCPRIENLHAVHEEPEFKLERRTLDDFTLANLGGNKVAIQVAKNLRILRTRRVTIRRTINTIIATRCIESGLELLHTDPDFDAPELRLGVKITNWKS